MANENSNVVVDRAQSHWSDLWKKEDYWAIWLGFALLIAAICISSMALRPVIKKRSISPTRL